MLKEDGIEFEGWRLRLTWASLLFLHAEWGEEFGQRFANAISRRDLADLSLVVEAAGGPKAEEVIALSPPILPLADALQVAWNWAHLGFKSAKGFESMLRAEAAEREAISKKPRRFRFPNVFGRRYLTPSEAA